MAKSSVQIELRGTVVLWEQYTNPTWHCVRDSNREVRSASFNLPRVYCGSGYHNTEIRNDLDTPCTKDLGYKRKVIYFLCGKL